MTKLDKLDQQYRRDRTRGWLAGLGILFAPWIVAGIISTFLSEPESAFPWVLGATFIAMTVWVGSASVRSAGFRSGALRGAAIAVGVVGLLVALLVAAQP